MSLIKSETYVDNHVVCKKCDDDGDDDDDDDDDFIQCYVRAKTEEVTEDAEIVSKAMLA